MLKNFQARAKHPIVLIHGGAGPTLSDAGLLERRRSFIREVLAQLWPSVRDGLPAVEAVTRIVEALEACPDFNAGSGGVIQSDGMVRLSASLMDGHRQKLSGVMLATHIIHPSKLAYALQIRRESVLGPLGAQLLARELGIPPQNAATPGQAGKWVSYLENPDRSDGHGTVGAVALDSEGRLAAATSTGGSNINVPERISDSATVAGNFASAFAAVSCTGIGEQIVDDGLAVKLETRVRDGRTIVAASDLAYEEAIRAGHEYGWIGIDRQGNWAMYCTTEDMARGMMSSELDAPMIA